MVGFLQCETKPPGLVERAHPLDHQYCHLVAQSAMIDQPSPSYSMRICSNGKVPLETVFSEMVSTANLKAWRAELKRQLELELLWPSSNSLLG